MSNGVIKPAIERSKSIRNGGSGIFKKKSKIDNPRWTTTSKPTSEYVTQEKYFKIGKHKDELKKSRAIVDSPTNRPVKPFQTHWDVGEETVVDVRRFKRGKSSGVTASGDIIPVLKKSKTKKMKDEGIITHVGSKWTRKKNK